MRSVLTKKKKKNDYILVQVLNDFQPP